MYGTKAKVRIRILSVPVTFTEDDHGTGCLIAVLLLICLLNIPLMPINSIELMKKLTAPYVPLRGPTRTVEGRKRRVGLGLPVAVFRGENGSRTPELWPALQLQLRRPLG